MKKRLSYLENKNIQILIGVALGILVGIMIRHTNLELHFLISSNLKKLGILFINLIRMISIPFVLVSIISSIISIDDTAKAGKIAITSIITFLGMTAVSVIIGITSAIILKPGLNSHFSKESVLTENSQIVADLMSTKISTSFGDFLFNIVPSNIFDAIAKGQLLQAIFFGCLFGFAMLRVKRDAQINSVIKAINGISAICMEMIAMIVRLAPIGLFGIIAWLVSTQSIEVMHSLCSLIGLISLDALIIVYGLYSVFTFFILKLNPIHFIRKIFKAQVMAFFTASSAATLPIAMDIAHKKIGVSKENTEFIMPIGATINMNGSALYFAVCSVFIAQLFGIELSLAQYCIIFLMSILCAIGTAPIPGSAILLLGNILVTAGLPIEAIGIILAIDRLLDMIRTFVNVSGDTYSAFAIDKLCKTLDVKAYKSKDVEC